MGALRRILDHQLHLPILTPFRFHLPTSQNLHIHRKRPKIIHILLFVIKIAIISIPITPEIALVVIVIVVVIIRIFIHVKVHAFKFGRFVCVTVRSRRIKPEPRARGVDGGEGVRRGRWVSNVSLGCDESFDRVDTVTV
jgi:hypothetical protein